AIDVERVLTLLRRPAELKSMVTLRFRQLWYDHFGPRWQQALPLCRSLAEQARRHFYLDDPERVLEAVAGRSGREHLAPVLHKRIVFIPVPFIGPYISMAAGPDLPVSYVGFGVVKGARANGEAARRDLLAALKALADDARLHALAYIRDRGQARAADLMQQFGWSQPNCCNPSASTASRDTPSTGTEPGPSPGAWNTSSRSAESRKQLRRTWSRVESLSHPQMPVAQSVERQTHESRGQIGRAHV